jgi:hypothetical protein
MAYETITTITRYTWLSTDTKPTECNDGSTGFERDTGKNYVYSTISGWIPAAMPIVLFGSSGVEIVPATSALQTTGNLSLANLDIALTTLRDAILGTSYKTITDIVDTLNAVVIAAGTNIIGKVGIDQTTPGTTNAVTPVNSSGIEMGNEANPVRVTVNGSSAELGSAKIDISAGSAVTYTRVSGATVIEIYVESGNVRVRTDGSTATATTGEPMGDGFSKAWAVSNVSIYALDASTITEVSR